MSVELAYGKSTLKLNLPEGVNPTVIRKIQLPIVPDSAVAIREALDKPIGAPPLSELKAEERISEMIFLIKMNNFQKSILSCQKEKTVR